MEKFQFEDVLVEKILREAKVMLKEHRSSSFEEKKILEKQKANIEAKMVSAENNLVNNVLDGKTFKKIYARLESELSNVNRGLEEASKDFTNETKKLANLLELAKNLGDSYRKASPELKKEYISIFFEKILIYKEKSMQAKLSSNMETLLNQEIVDFEFSWGG